MRISYPDKPWWTGYRARCHSCGGIVELEEEDTPSKDYDFGKDQDTRFKISCLGSAPGRQVCGATIRINRLDAKLPIVDDRPECPACMGSGRLQIEEAEVLIHLLGHSGWNWVTKGGEGR